MVKSVSERLNRKIGDGVTGPNQHQHFVSLREDQRKGQLGSIGSEHSSTSDRNLYTVRERERGSRGNRSKKLPVSAKSQDYWILEVRWTCGQIVCRDYSMMNQNQL